MAGTLAIELSAGLLLALALDRVTRARGLVRTAVLLPWAIPTVVAALVWRFIFESPFGLASALVAGAGLEAPTWFADAVFAWLPLVLADAWKTTPFVAVLLLAGLQTIDRELYEAAAVDGAGAGGSSPRSRCRCWRRRWSWPDCSARSTPSASSTWCT